MRFQIGARIDQQREARRVRLRKPVQRECGDRLDDLLGCGADDSLLRHARAQLPLDLLHPLRRSLESERAPQLLGLAAGKPGRDHRYPE